jgi:hypothetical protein
MSDLLLPPENAGMPWSRLVEAGWKIQHLSHPRAGHLEALIKSSREHILMEGPDTHDFWTRLEVKAGIEKRAALPPKVAPVKDPRHAELMGAWSGAFLRQFGQKYVVQGAADGMGVKRFLSNQPEVTVSGIMEIAREAWEHQEANPFCTACKRSRSIASFFSAWNDIVAELQTAKPKTNGSTFKL